MDTFIHPHDFSIMQCIQGVRVLYECQEFRKKYRHIPRIDELRERLTNLLVQARIENERQNIDEIYDTAIQIGVPMIDINYQEREYQRYNQPSKYKQNEKFALQTIAADKQNVHNHAINNSVKEIAKNICLDYPCNHNLLYSIKTKLSTRKSWDEINKDTLEFIQTKSITFRD